MNTTYSSLEGCLEQIYGYKTFREKQKDIIENILNGKDVLAILPTGHGKSICYQLPALYLRKIGIVISPLISLMEDQKNRLNELGILSYSYNSSVQNKQIMWRNIVDGKCLLMYITPETVVNCKELLSNIYQSVGISLFAIDEAHCISAWGQTFRPAYKELSCLKIWFPNVPIMALTGTATNLVAKDIYQKLLLKEPYVIRTSADRKNLSYFVEKKSSPEIDICSQLSKDESTIVYCLTREETENISFILRQHGYSAEAYHAGLNSDIRKNVQTNFMEGKSNCIVATISFGMGIDKSNVRKIIHYGCPRDIESYLQETGRAGRDGKESKCIIFYSGKDSLINKLHIGEINDPSVRAHKMKMNAIIEKYLQIPTCRREYLLNYLGETLMEKSSLCCDNCIQGKSIINKDITIPIRAFLSFLVDFNGKFGKKKFISAIRGSKCKDLPSSLKNHQIYGEYQMYSEDEWKYWITCLCNDGFIYEKKITTGKFNYGSTLYIDSMGQSWLLDDTSTYIIMCPNKTEKITKKQSTKKQSTKKQSIQKQSIKEQSIQKQSIQKQSIEEQSIQEQIEPKYDRIDCKKIVVNVSPGKNIIKFSSTQQESFDMFCKEKMSIKEIALKRNMTTTTIEGHIAHAMSLGMITEFDRLNLTKDIYDKVFNAIKSLDDDYTKLKPIREIVGKKISYFHIKCCISLMTSNNSHLLN